MLLFLASVLEQLDLALEHISKGDIHNARFGLMLTDNAVELVLHQIAKDKASDLKMFAYRREEYPHQAALDKALGRAFDAKVKLAKLEGGLSEQLAQTITIMHGFRNEVYHIGLKHETILPALSVFYFDVVCTYLGTYKSRGLSWGANLRLPDRAKKYFRGDKHFPAEFGDFARGCETLRTTAQHDPAHTIETLADDMDDVISQQNIYIDVIAGGVYEGQQTTRDGAVLDTQGWRLAFSEVGKLYAFDHGFRGNMLELVEWLASDYPHKFRADPIPSWQAQAARLRANKNPHIALSNYQSFMASTADLREALDQSA
ncbi:MAG: hypothetical protein C3F11_05035, partial [Methylocystaceae bacterium]